MPEYTNVLILAFSSIVCLFLTSRHSDAHTWIKDDIYGFSLTYELFSLLSVSIITIIGITIFLPTLHTSIVDYHGGAVLTSADSGLPRTLPDKSYCSEEEYASTRRSLTIENKGSKNEKFCSPEASWALVTGASKGIGRAVAISLARRRIPSILVARDQEELEYLAKEISDCYKIECIPLQCDLSDKTKVENLVTILNEMTFVTFGEEKKRVINNIDILINNAGVGYAKDFLSEDTSTENIMDTISLNIVGTTLLTKAIGREMKSARITGQRNTSGRIVTISSVMGIVPGHPGCAVYAATKAYQRSFCASLRREMELLPSTAHCITVACILPGAVRDTNFKKTASMQNAPVFWLPAILGLALRPDHVAEATVKAVVNGRQGDVVVGLTYQLTFYVIAKLLPERATQILSELLTRPWKNVPKIATIWTS